MSMMQYVVSCLWFALPAYVGNMAPVFAKKVFRDRYDTPVDFKKTLRGRRLSGSNKTYRGILAAIAVSMFIVFVQRHLYGVAGVRSISLVDYQDINWLAFGTLMGLGAMMGDLVKSVVKRQLDKHPGESWRQYDQIDFLVGSLVFTSVVYLPPMRVIHGNFLVVPLVKVAVDHLGVFLGVYESKW